MAVISLDDLNLHGLADVYVLANTPAYLYRWFRADESVRALARSHPTGELASRLNTILDQHNLGFDELILAYALLVCLTMKDYREARPFIEHLAYNRLEWATEILEIWEAIRTVIVTASHSPAPEINLPSQPVGKAAVQHVDFTMRPRIDHVAVKTDIPLSLGVLPLDS
jgi:hypothetical protein